MISSYHFSPSNLQGLKAELGRHGVTEAMIKPLSRNHNDKNQVYSGSDFRPLFPTFDMTFSFRGASESKKKKGQTKGQPIPEAVFAQFYWAKTDGQLVAARNVKMIIYAQYPETRLSAFQTVDNDMPPAMSVEFTKKHQDIKRFLVLGRRGAGEVVALMVVDPGPGFNTDLEALPKARGSRVWRHLKLKAARNSRLVALLRSNAKIDLPGCRMTSDGSTVPFKGTQVCGYTLEHALQISPNSSKYGDFEGIELKAHTQKKVTLFTPEPDLGMYSEDFERFMTTYGYKDASGHYRVTGIHKIDVPSPKSNLTLRIVNHERGAPLAASVDDDVHVGLVAMDGTLAAGWSLERLLNCWSAKHNEVVYVPATKTVCTDDGLLDAGYKFTVRFSDRVMWCRDTSAEQLFEALYNGTLFLDPAPKFCPGQPALNKRRSQWRVNDIAVAAKDLYNDVQFVELSEDGAADAKDPAMKA